MSFVSFVDNLPILRVLRGILIIMQTKEHVQVLIVENNYLVSEMVRGLLTKIGYTVVGHAADGLQAVELTQQLQPHVVIMDIQMPDMNGIEATRRIYELCPTPIVMLTAYEDPELLAQASEAGAGAYLLKPAKAPDLDRAITISVARFKDMVALRQLNNKLQQLNKELQIQNEELDSFAHTVAHDLKNPLHLITAYTEILADEVKLEGELEGVLDIVVQTSHKMNNIIDELMLLAGVRKANIEPLPLNMAEVLGQVEHRLSYMFEKSEGKLFKPQEWPIPLGHAPWVEEVWVNYLTNGLKYGGHPPALELGAEELTNGQARFWVRDNGPGLSLEKQSQLFMPFNRLGQIRAEGHGLGLSIVQRIIHRLGGEVSVESIEGHGCTFSFTLPLA